ncbi:hypothetical protein GCM10010341_22170 [Streptomyces noursei]|nr:hypothetical protein GCM10010341_22170 [Streptomyces noursei]
MNVVASYRRMTGEHPAAVGMASVRPEPHLGSGGRSEVQFRNDAVAEMLQGRGSYA